MTQIWEYIKIAFMNIKSNKGRSILTMLGIIIGISSVIMIISIGNSVKGAVNDSLDSIAGGQIRMVSYENEEGLYVEFTNEDLEFLQEKVKNIKAVTPYFVTYGSVDSRKGSFSGNVVCGSTGMLYGSSEPIVKGHYFTESDYYMAKRVCVLDEYSAKELFGTTNVLGMTVDMTLWNREEEFTIVGIRNSQESGLMAAVEGQSLSVEIPYTIIGSYFGAYLDTFTDILIVSDGAEHSTQVANDSLRLMENRYNVRGKNVIQIVNFTDVLSAITSILDYITIFVVMVAAISLLVGGIGVMNIMLVSVTERTREIGIRKALGARTGSILLQFLSESAIISLMGGLIGILLGVLGAAGICSIIGAVSEGMEMTLRIEPSTVIGASTFSMAVGVFFGIYPARKAAKLSPIEALRHE